MNLGEFKSIGTYSIALYVNGNNIIYFDSFGVEHISKEIKKFIGYKNMITNIYRKQAYNFRVIEKSENIKILHVSNTWDFI